jgi:hypothetical protein
MNRLRVFSFVVILLSGLSHFSRGQVIDSAHWPFPDTIWIKYSAFGQYSGSSWDARIGNGQKNSTLPHPDSLFSSRFADSLQFFTRANILSVDSEACVLLKGDYPNDMVWARMVLDTLNHVIRSIDLKERGHSGVSALSAEVYLKKLRYSQLRIDFQEPDIFRHVDFLSFSDDYETSFGDDRTDFCCPTTLTMFGNTLRSGLACPILVNCGSLRLDSISDKTIAVTNSSNADIKIRSYSLQGQGFQVVDTSLHDLAASGSGSIRIRFNPTLEQPYSGRLTISTNEDVAATYLVTLFGSVIPKASVSHSSELQKQIQLSLYTSLSQTGVRIIAPSPIEDVQSEIYDATGRLLISQNLGKISEGSNEIPISMPSMHVPVFLRFTSGGETLGVLPFLVGF